MIHFSCFMRFILMYPCWSTIDSRTNWTQSLFSLSPVLNLSSHFTDSISDANTPPSVVKRRRQKRENRKHKTIGICVYTNCFFQHVSTKSIHTALYIKRHFPKLQLSGTGPGTMWLLGNLLTIWLLLLPCRQSFYMLFLICLLLSEYFGCYSVSYIKL